MSRVSCRSRVENAIAKVRSPRRDGSPTEKGSRPSPEFVDFVRDDFRRLGGQGEEGEEIPPRASGPIGVGLRGAVGSLRPRTVRSRCTLSRGVGPGRATHLGIPARTGWLPHGPGGSGVRRPPCLPGNGTGRIEGTWRGEDTDSQRTCGDRQLYDGPGSSCAPCSAGRTSGETRRNARSAAPTRSSSSNMPTETTRSSTTSAPSATSEGTRAFPIGMSPRPGRTTRPTNEIRGG